MHYVTSIQKVYKEDISRSAYTLYCLFALLSFWTYIFQRHLDMLTLSVLWVVSRGVRVVGRSYKKKGGGSRLYE